MIEMNKETSILPQINSDKAIQIISRFIKGVIDESNTQGLVVGLSGGLDSATAAYISARAADKDKVLGLIMPSKTTPQEDVEDALSVAENLGIGKEIISIDSFIEPFDDLHVHSFSKKHNKIAIANLKARIRMMILYYHANSMNRLVVGTGNRSELLVGYFTKYGDGGVDILPLGDLYKTQVRQIAAHLEIPENIINKAPTAGLWSGQTDEDELGIKYHLLDELLYLLEDEQMEDDQVAGKLKIPKEEVLRIKSMIKSAAHKLTPPPIPLIR